MNGNSALLDSNIIIYLSKREVPLSFLDQFNNHFALCPMPYALSFNPQLVTRNPDLIINNQLLIVNY
jgi:hypothetical protein